MRDLHTVMNMASGIDCATRTADSVPAAVDLSGYDGAEVILAIGAGGVAFDATNKIEFVLTHSDDNVTYTNVTDADMLGVTGIVAGKIKSLVAAHAAAAVYRYGYIGTKRYLKLLADFSGSHVTGTPMAGVIVRGRPSIAPTLDQA